MEQHKIQLIEQKLQMVEEVCLIQNFSFLI
jgi:hypothetical protein